MRLIDADAFLENNKGLAECDFNHLKYCDTLRDLVNNAPTACDIDAIREEIGQIVEQETAHDEKWARGLHYALCVIEKHMKGEQG